MQLLPLRLRPCAVSMLASSFLWAGGCAQSPPPAARSSAAADGSKPTLPKIADAFRLTLLSGTKDCTNAGVSCPVEVKMSKIVDSTGTYCVAEVPAEIKFGGTDRNNPPKLIVWTLVPKDATFDLTVEFQEDFGVLMLKNDKGQIDKGGWGDGSGGTQKNQYHMKNKHKETSTSLYLPIILQIGAPGEAPKMCAAADPKIVNN
jgi:hypothetical protein